MFRRTEPSASQISSTGTFSQLKDKWYVLRRCRWERFLHQTVVIDPCPTHGKRGESVISSPAFPARSKVRPPWSNAHQMIHSLSAPHRRLFSLLDKLAMKLNGTIFLLDQPGPFLLSFDIHARLVSTTFTSHSVQSREFVKVKSTSRIWNGRTKTTRNLVAFYCKGRTC